MTGPTLWDRSKSWPQSLKTTVGLMIHSPVALVLLWGPDGIMIYNDAYGVFAGNRHPGLLGQKVLEGWPEAADLNSHVMAVCMAGGTLQYKDRELALNRRGKPEAGWMDLFYSPVIDESGKPGGVIAVVVETTQRVLAERAQADATARQRRQFEQAPGFVIVMGGPEHVVEFANHAHRRSFGSDNWVGKTIREAFPSLEGQGFFELLDGVYKTGVPYQAESEPVRYRRAPDAPEELRYLTFIYAPITDDTGAISGMFCEGFDVSETYKAQKALRDLNADLERKIIERTQARGRTWQVSPDLMGALNAKGYFETSNPAWQTMLGWTEEEVARMSIFELLHPDDVERTRAGFALTQIGQPAIRFPNRYRCKDGSYRWISWVGVPEDGMVYCSGRDITEEKAGGSRTAGGPGCSCARRKRWKRWAISPAASRTISTICCRASPARSTGRSIAWREGRIGDIDRFLKAAAESANRAAALTHRLLAFSRRQTLDPKPTDVNRLIAGMEDLIRRTVGPDVDHRSGGRGGPVADPGGSDSQLENSLLNLCINARDAMPDGGS